jgi:hypothetical protein
MDASVRELTLRGIGVEVVGMYVEDLGGQVVDTRPGSASYEGPGWRIELRAAEPVRVGSVQLGVTIVRVEGQQPVVQQVEALLSKKVLRAGG